ncbi:MAG TPA: hypothetical protein VHX39_09115 [Acetobacteraceae bacterium]|jgi:hypothetical protein|nr:hypothetical protein [Acetobacteraceae bacterium]
MANKLDHIPALATCAAAAGELSEAEMNEIVGGTGKQASSGGSAQETVTFEYGALMFQYGR